MSFNSIFCQECGEELNWEWDDDYGEDLIVFTCSCSSMNKQNTKLHKNYNKLAAKIKKLETQLILERNKVYELNRQLERTKETTNV